MIPDGYQPHTRRSPLTDPWEPLYARESGDAIDLAVEIRTAHCNGRGQAHGGLISALADNAMGLSAVHQARTRGERPGANAVTTSLVLDFIDSGRIGDWLEFRPTVLKLGRTLAFVECKVLSGERLVARGSAAFRMLEPDRPAAPR